MTIINGNDNFNTIMISVISIMFITSHVLYIDASKSKQDFIRGHRGTLLPILKLEF